MKDLFNALLCYSLITGCWLICIKLQEGIGNILFM